MSTQIANPTVENNNPTNAEAEAYAAHGYNFYGQTRTGRSISYYIKEPDLSLATEQLSAAGVVLDRIVPRRVFRRTRNRLPKRADYAALAHQLAEQLDAGVPISRACVMLGNSTNNGFLAKAVLDAGEQIMQGRTMTDAFALQQTPGDEPMFPVTFINALRIGESGGEIGTMLKTFAEAQIKADNVIGKIRSASIYPLIVLAIAIVLSLVFMYFVMPQIAQFYTTLLPPGDNSLPLPTRMMVALSEFLLSVPGAITMVVLVLAVIGFIRWLKTEKGRDWLQRHNIKWPLVGELLRHYHASVVLRTISMLAKSGATMDSMLDQAGTAATNPVYAEMLHDIKEFLYDEGTALATAFTPYGYLMGDEFRSVLITHEKTGNTEELFAKYASVLETRVERYVERVTKLIEPILIVGIAGFIFLFVLAVYTPLFQMLGKMAKTH